MTNYIWLRSDGVPIKAWVKNVHIDDNARQQLRNAAQMPSTAR
jgi:hypothetical protein